MKNIELQHIQIELQNNRCLPRYLRSFADAWFCHENGYENSKGNVDWHSIARNEYVTDGVMKTSNDKLIVDKEHIIPLSVIAKKLLQLGTDATLNQIEDVLRQWMIFATILKTEDKILNLAGLRSKMPKEFYDKNHELYDDKFARYKITGIELKNNKK